jgi:DNA topoisomerase-1
VPEEYWTVTALFRKQKEFSAKLHQYMGQKIALSKEEDTDRVLSAIKGNVFTVETVEEKERQRKPYAPFTTSSLQQEASAKLNFTAKKTMQIAQQLYEGIMIKGDGTAGLVTYIRTDSVRISQEAKEAAKTYINERFGTGYHSDNFFSSKKKEVQDAHEAIRPSSIELDPEKIKDSLNKDQYNLYRLIWSRFVASQMKPAIYYGVSADIENSGYMFRATGSKLKFDGFLKVYSPGKEDEKMLPHLEKGETLDAEDILADQNFTQPPARFTEASLVKELEERNIGRPSTYAPIIGTLTERKYIIREKKLLVPTDLGELVNQMMNEYFKNIVDLNFTAEMEDRLDDVEIRDTDWKEIIRDFYADFKKDLEHADNNIEKVEIEDIKTDEVCEKCGRHMVIKHGRFGDFMACSGYPECKNTKQILKTTGVPCSRCGKDIVQRKSKKGKIFYGCSGYPNCNELYWNKPIEKKCPKCGAYLVEKKSKDPKYACSNSECDYKE